MKLGFYKFIIPILKLNLKYSSIRIYQIKIQLDITTNNKYKQ